MKEQWLEWAIELQSLAQAGLTYGKDIFDRERYERIREISAEIMAYKTDIPVQKVSVKENTIKEVKEEAGLDVTADKVIAIQDRSKHNLPVYAYGVCKIFVLCTIIGGAFKENIETTGFAYFSENELPELATEKNNEEQVKMCFEAYRTKNWSTLFD